MLNKQIRLYIYAKPLITAFLFVLICSAAVAQAGMSDMESFFSANPRHEVRLYKPKANKIISYCWIENDTVYSAGEFNGFKIAIADIDFTKKMIANNGYFVEVINTEVSEIKLWPKKGKFSFGFWFLLSDKANNSEAPSSNPVTLRINGSQAEKAFAYLQLKYTEYLGRNPIDFDAQLGLLVTSLRKDFASHKGPLIKDNDNEYRSKQSLEGALNTYIHFETDNVYLVAEFGEFSSFSEAGAVYAKIADKVSDAKKMPYAMVRQKEITTANSKVVGWLPIDKKGKEVPPEMKGLTLLLELQKTSKFDKNFKKADVYYVQLKISK